MEWHLVTALRFLGEAVDEPADVDVEELDDEEVDESLDDSLVSSEVVELVLDDELLRR